MYSRATDFALYNVNIDIQREVVHSDANLFNGENGIYEQPTKMLHSFVAIFPFGRKSIRKKNY